MIGLLWCLQVVWVGLVFGVVFVVSGGLLLGVYFDCRRRYAQDSLKSLFKQTHKKEDESN